MAKRLFIIVVLALTFVVPTLSGQSKSPLHGAWAVTEDTPARGANAGKPMKTQPGIFVFTDRHYAVVRVLGDTPRQVTRKDPVNPTVAELQEENRIAAQGGTYEIKGDTITFRRVAARSITNMAPGNSAVETFKIEGNTLTLIGLGVGRAGGGVMKLTRLE
jgi:hypothetical protein